MKFGGSSLANPARIRNYAKIVQRCSEDNQIGVVASAVDDATDRLVAIGELAQQGKTAELRRSLAKLQMLHLKTAQQTSRRRMAKDLLDRINQLNTELERTVEGISHLRELTPRSKDYLLSFGERLSTPILASAIRGMGLKATALTGAEAGITTDDNFGE